MKHDPAPGQAIACNVRESPLATATQLGLGSVASSVTSTAPPSPAAAQVAGAVQEIARSAVPALAAGLVSGVQLSPSALCRMMPPAPTMAQAVGIAQVTASRSPPAVLGWGD